MLEESVKVVVPPQDKLRKTVSFTLKVSYISKGTVLLHSVSQDISYISKNGQFLEPI